MRFTLEVELENPDVCDSCKFFVAYDPYQMGGSCICESKEVPEGKRPAQWYANIPRPSWCPLRKEEG